MQTINYNSTFFITADGSPSLIGSQNEAMHSRKGAFTETLYIYNSALTKHSLLNFSPRYLSVGLGLAYNEMLVFAQILQQKNTEDKNIILSSYESEDWLRKSCIHWLQKNKDKKVENVWFSNYNVILNLVADHFRLNPLQIKSLMLKFYENNQWQINPSLTRETQFSVKHSMIFFDAYSEKTSPELWSDEFLKHFFLNACDSDCVFSTYAAKGRLFRKLKEEGFAVEEKKGFAGKRQSTFAIRKKF